MNPTERAQRPDRPSAVFTNLQGLKAPYKPGIRVLTPFTPRGQHDCSQPRPAAPFRSPSAPRRRRRSSSARSRSAPSRRAPMRPRRAAARRSPQVTVYCGPAGINDRLRVRRMVARPLRRRDAGNRCGGVRLCAVPRPARCAVRFPNWLRELVAVRSAKPDFPQRPRNAEPPVRRIRDIEN